MGELVGSLIKVSCAGVIFYFILGQFNRDFAKMAKYLTYLTLVGVVLDAWDRLLRGTYEKFAGFFVSMANFMDKAAAFFDKWPFH